MEYWKITEYEKLLTLVENKEAKVSMFEDENLKIKIKLMQEAQDFQKQNEIKWLKKFSLGIPSLTPQKIEINNRIDELQ